MNQLTHIHILPHCRSNQQVHRNFHFYIYIYILIHDSEFSKSRVFLDYITMNRPCSVIFIDDFTKFNASIKSFSDIERQKFSTSKFIKDNCFLLLIFLNQLMTFEVFFHSLTFVLLRRELLILSKICLVILPISNFDGLISLNDKEFGNLLYDLLPK